MPFQKSAQSWRARAHASRVRLPVVAGILLIGGLVLVAAGCALTRIATADGFELVHASETAQASELSAGGDASGEASANAGAGGAGGAAALGEAGAVACVHVVGAVVTPGVYEVRQGARVGEAITAAGGFSEGAATNALNLARVLSDGEQVVVPTEEEVAAAQVAGAGATGSSASAVAGAAAGGVVNINMATVAELDTLPGIGEATAERIIADRQSNGPFQSPEDLKRVSGIGDKKYEQLAGLISVG